MKIDCVIDSPVSQSIRARQVEALFDVPPEERQRLEWHGDVPLDEREWNVGLIVGPSGSGKTTIARELFGKDSLAPKMKWSTKSVVDDFPKTMTLDEIASICMAVGFNTIPAWMRRFDVLSNGEQFRVMLARLLAESPALVVLDEFTSVVDRQVAKIGSHAVQKYVRKRGTKFVAVSCHSDVIEWLNPDWILEPASMSFSWRELRPRPTIECEIAKVPYETWGLFAKYHYLTAHLHRAAQCYCLFVNGEPAAFAGMLYRPHRSADNIWGLSRLVTLPDYQGLGLAFVLCDKLAAMFASASQRFNTYPAHPALIRAFDNSPIWKLQKAPGLSNRNTTGLMDADGRGYFGGRPNAVFTYVGRPFDDVSLARKILDINALGGAKAAVDGEIAPDRPHMMRRKPVKNKLGKGRARAKIHLSKRRP